MSEIKMIFLKIDVLERENFVACWLAMPRRDESRAIDEANPIGARELERQHQSRLN
jgi:hypothetical protein